MKFTHKLFHAIFPSLMIALVVFIGTSLLGNSEAASSYISILTNTGQLGGQATILSSTNGPSYVQFGKSLAQNTYQVSVNGPTMLTVGGTGNYQISANSAVTLNNVIVDFEVYNSSNHQVYQSFQSGVSLTSTTSTFNENWTPSSSGQYSIDIGIFTANWANNLYWGVNKSSVNVSLPTICPSGQIGTPPNCSTPSSSSQSLSVYVKGNKLYNQNNQPIQLRGVDRSGTEYACVQGWGMSDGPLSASSISYMKSWGINAVRVPLNEDCWLGINGVSAAYSGTAYQTVIKNYVNALNQAGIIAIVDLHWNGPGTTLATKQLQMADADHAPAFWTSVANYFKNNHAMIFDLYNEPNNISWSCWKNGCNSPGWQTAGMQQLVNSVRSTGATQPLMLGGLWWANDVTGWLANKPNDPLNQLIASVHMYQFNSCNSVSCWNQQIAPVAQVVPIVTGELGETDCSGNFISSYMSWADSLGISYLSWSWDAGGGWSCSNGPSLITNYNGTPNTPYGSTYMNHLKTLAGL